MRFRAICVATFAACYPAFADAHAQGADSVSIRILNVELRAAVQILQQHLDRPVVFTGNSANANASVTLETPRPVPRSSVLALLRGLLEGNGYELVSDSTAPMYRARPRAPASPFPTAARSAPPPAQAALELFVLPLKHARATDVAATISALYGRDSQFGATTNRPPTLADELRGNQVPPAGAPPAVGAQPVPVRSSTLTGELVVVPDARANSLLVRANRADFALVQAVVQQVDVRPLQVMIEVLIVEVRRNRSLRLGVEATLRKTDVGSAGASLQGSLSSGPGLGDFALKVMRLGGLDLDATISAAAANGEARVLSRPVVFTTNNEEAEIVVGTQRPFVQVSRTLPTDAGARDQIVQYKEVGTKLRVRPTISVDGSVQLEVAQEVSGATSETAFDAPVLSTRSVRTSLLIEDGQTMALGGLTDNQRETAQSGLPLLSSIPLLGALFGHAARRADETELFVFLTPRVIRTAEDAARLSGALQDRVDRQERR